MKLKRTGNRLNKSKGSFSVVRCLLAVLFCCGGNLYAKPDLIEFENIEEKFIGKKCLFIEDVNHSYSIQDIWKKYQKNEFAPCEKSVFVRLASESSFWFAFSIKSTSMDEAWLNINNIALDSIHYYKLNHKGEVIRSRLGGHLASLKNAYNNTFTFREPLIDSGDSTTYNFFIKVHSVSTVEVPIEVGNYDSLMQSKWYNEFFALFFVGALSIMFIYNCFIFFYTKERVYLYYLLYIICIIFTTSFLNNFPIIEYILGTKFTYHYILIWIAPGFIFIGLLFIEYLNLKERYPKMYYIFFTEMMVLFGISLLNLFMSGPELATVYSAFAALVLMSSLFFGYLCLDIRSAGSILFTLGWTIMVVSCLIYILVINGLLEYHLILRNSMYFGIFIEVVLFSISLAKQANDLRMKYKILNNELVHKNEELILTNDSLDSYNYHVNHDLKSTLGNISSLTIMASKYFKRKDFDKVHEIAERILKVSIQGKETVQRFLSLGSSEKELLSGEKENINLSDKIEDLLERNQLTSKINIHVSHLDFIVLNKRMFDEIFLNLITNTIKFNVNFPQAEIKLFETKKSYTLIYTDNSIGIDIEKNGHKLFQPFTKIIFNKNGVGLGLYLIKRLLNNSGGKIEVKSSLNEGIEFIIELQKHKNKIF